MLKRKIVIMLKRKTNKVKQLLKEGKIVFDSIKGQENLAPDPDDE